MVFIQNFNGLDPDDRIADFVLALRVGYFARQSVAIPPWWYIRHPPTRYPVTGTQQILVTGYWLLATGHWAGGWFS